MNYLLNDLLEQKCRVLSVDNDILYLGVADNVVDNSSIVVKFDICVEQAKVGDKLQVFCKNKKGEDILFSGFVVNIEGSNIHINNITFITNNARAYYRIKTDISANVFLNVDEEMISSDEESDGHIFDVKIKDISGGGLQFLALSDCTIQEKDDVVIYFNLLNNKMMVSLSVKKKFIKDDLICYACSFYDLYSKDKSIIDHFIAEEDSKQVKRIKILFK
ncbi:MAG: PilZ domain-containing protein [Oscillospiraceae bacterium]